MLVGDILLSAREAVPDLPGTLPAPQTLTEIHVAPVTFAGANLNALGTYYYVCTYTMPWGETSPGPEGSITLAGTQNALSFNPAPSPFLWANPWAPAATGFNVYLGLASGAEVQRYSFSLLGQEYIVGNMTGTFVFAPPPQGNSAFLLDSGGAVASAQQLFRWLSDALHALAAANGGIPDVCGFRTQLGRQNYPVPGEWKTLTDAWFDGYPIDMGSSNGVFRRNGLNGQVSQMSYTQVADTLVVELYPQPIRSGGTGQLTAAITSTDLTAPASLNGFLLPFGLAMLGAPPTYEIVSYGTGGGLQQMVRGLGGTNAQAWPNGTPVAELNCAFAGKRAPQLYTVGQALNSIRIPPDWTPYIHLYLLARYRTIEQQQQEAATLMKEFDTYTKGVSKRKPVLGDRQIQPQDNVGLDIRSSRAVGGIIIP